MKRLFTTLFARALLGVCPAHADSFKHHGVTDRRGAPGAAYTMDNSPSGNNVWAFGRKLTVGKAFSAQRTQGVLFTAQRH